MPIIVTSDRDPASKNIRGQLIKLFGFREKPSYPEFDGRPVYASGDTLMIISEKELVDSEHIEQTFTTDLLIFASRHRSAVGKPAMLVHCTGNWTREAELGGRPCQVAVAPASAMRKALFELAKERDELGLEKYEVTMECTHHGPTSLSTPLLFIELGSDELHWADEVAAQAVAKAIYRVAGGVREVVTSLGIGGPHYAPNFTKILFSSSGIAIGHIIPSYVLDRMGKEMVREAIRRTLEKVKSVLLDWKGLRAEHRNFIRPVLEEIGIEVVRTYEVTKNA